MAGQLEVLGLAETNAPCAGRLKDAPHINTRRDRTSITVYLALEAVVLVLVVNVDSLLYRFYGMVGFVAFPFEIAR